MSWFASDERLSRVEVHDVIDDWEMTKSEKREFVDVALHVGCNEIIRITLPSGAWFTVDDAAEIRDALTRQIDDARRRQIHDLKKEMDALYGSQ